MPVSGVTRNVEIELVFVLPLAAVREMMYFAQPRYQFLYFRNEASQKFMYHTGTVLCFIRNKVETGDAPRRFHASMLQTEVMVH